MRYGFLFVLALAAAVWFWYPAADSNPIRFQTEQLSVGDIESVVNTAGTTRAVVTVAVGTEVSGLITELLVDFNDTVSQGQLIARLDARSYQARVRQSEADVVMAQANLAQQQAGLQRANAELARAERAYQRQQQLLRQQLSNQSESDTALADFDIATAQISLVQAQIQSADAQLLQRQAALEQAQLDLDRTNIRSPVNGIVIDRQVDIGQTVAASKTFYGYPMPPCALSPQVLPPPARPQRQPGSDSSSRHPPGQTGSAGLVWVLDAQQTPQPVRVRIGLSNDEYSELVSDELSAGAEVIVRAVRLD